MQEKSCANVGKKTEGENGKLTKQEIITIINLINLCLTCFNLGFNMGKDKKNRK